MYNRDGSLMSATFTVLLPEKLRAAVDDQVAKGGYASRDEYVLDLIRRDQARAGQRQLAAELSARADDTDSVVMDADDSRQIRAELRRRLGEADAQ
jgi:antitoxin ParD1/3/4